MTGGARLQRGVLHRRARPGREPHRRREPRLGHGEDDARQRAGVALDGRRVAVGLRPERARPRAADEDGRRASPTATLRQRLMDAYIEGEILRYHRMRMISAAVNKKPGPDASLRKALADPHGKRVFWLGQGPHGRGRHARRHAARSDPSGTRGCAASCSAPRSPSAAARARCCATSSPSACSASPTTTTSSRARPSPRATAARAARPGRHARSADRVSLVATSGVCLHLAGGPPGGVPPKGETSCAPNAGLVRPSAGRRPRR